MSKQKIFGYWWVDEGETIHPRYALSAYQAINVEQAQLIIEDLQEAVEEVEQRNE